MVASPCMRGVIAFHLFATLITTFGAKFLDNAFQTLAVLRLHLPRTTRAACAIAQFLRILYRGSASGHVHTHKPPAGQPAGIDWSIDEAALTCG